jgi:hypothetical protein
MIGAVGATEPYTIITESTFAARFLVSLDRVWWLSSARLAADQPGARSAA